MRDSPFMSAKEKERVLQHWTRFLESGCRKDRFTGPLYEHLIQHCSFIAHYDIHGFYDCYFRRGEDTVRFLSQFDGSKDDPPPSVEYGGTYWAGGEYADINLAMIEAAAPFIAGLTQRALWSQRSEDIDMAKRLLAKYGISMPD